MRASTHRSENETSAIDAIDEHPIRFNMALPMTAMVADELMIPHHFRKCVARTKTAQRFLKLAHIPAALFCKLVVLLELGRVFKAICHGQSSSREAIIASTLSKGPVTLRPVTASSIAASVSGEKPSGFAESNGSPPLRLNADTNIRNALAGVVPIAEHVLRNCSFSDFVTLVESGASTSIAAPDIAITIQRKAGVVFYRQLL